MLGIGLARYWLLGKKRSFVVGLPLRHVHEVVAHQVQYAFVLENRRIVVSRGGGRKWGTTY